MSIVDNAVRADIRSLPGLLPPRLYEPIEERSQGGLKQVLLPSGHRAVHLTSYADVHRILTSPSMRRSETNVADGPTFLPTLMPPEMLLNLDVPDHARLKGFVAGAYSASTMSRRVPSVEHALELAMWRLRRDHRQGCEHGPGVVDLVAGLLDPLTIAVNVQYLGIADDDVSSFRHLSREMQLAHDDDVPSLEAHFWQLYGYLGELVAGQRDLRPGLILDLLAARDSVQPAVSDAELQAILLGALVGGDQNVLSVVTKMAYVCLALPQLWQFLAEHPERTEALVEELLRLLPLGRISTFPRIASTSLDLEAGTLFPGEIAYADAHEANRDPAVYPDPWIVDVERTGPKHLQFGYGMHHCMGAAMARMEITATLRTLALELPELALAARPSHIEWETGVLVHRPVSLPVTW